MAVAISLVHPPGSIPGIIIAGSIKNLHIAWGFFVDCLGISSTRLCYPSIGLMAFLVGPPGIEPGLNAPHALVLPVYYGPSTGL